MNRFGKLYSSIERVVKSNDGIYNVSLDSSGNFNFNNKRLKNVQEARDSNDAITLTQLQKEKDELISAQRLAIQQLISKNEMLVSSLKLPYFRGFYNGPLITSDDEFEPHPDDSDTLWTIKTINLATSEDNIYNIMQTNFNQYPNILEIQEFKFKILKPCFIKITIGILNFDQVDTIKDDTKFKYNLHVMVEKPKFVKDNQMCRYSYREAINHGDFIPKMQTIGYYFEPDERVQFTSTIMFDKTKQHTNTIIKLYCEINIFELIK
jgi:hypothetical protein